MLFPVFARAGSNKNEFILEKIRSSVKSSSKKVMLLVPEQSSFETEKQLYLSLGDRDFSKVEVVSFTRLCSLINAKYGGMLGERLSEAGKLILASTAAENATESLKVYAGQVKNAAFAKEVSALIDELKVAGVSPEQFEASLSEFDDNALLKDKLCDISNIYHFYDALVNKGYLDPSDELASAYKRLGNGEFFKDYNVIIDEFASFNSAQLSIISQMLSNSDEVTLILCSVPAPRRLCPAAFRTPLDTLGKIKRLASNNGVNVAEENVLSVGEGFNSDALGALERLAAAQDFEAPQDISAVTVSSAISVKLECRHVAAEIRRLVMNKKLRYRDIAVIGREMDSYLHHLEDSFRLYDIPFFCDKRSSIDTRPAALFIISLLETIISDIEPSVFVRYLKCPISPIDSDSASELENYIELWRLNKKQLLSDFVKNPNGLDGEIDEKGLERLLRLNEIRKQTVLPLLELKKQILKADGNSITRALYSFMEQNGVINKLSELTEALSQTDSALASEQYRAYKVCLSVMSQLSALLKEQKVSLKRYLELFRLALNAEDVGSIPHHLDEVQVGDGARIRTDGIKVSFLVGMNEGVFPKRHSENGLFSDSDRKAVRSAGIDVLTPSAVMNQNEDYYLYCALCSATDEVHISYSRNTQKGEPIFASKIVNKIVKGLGIEETNLSFADPKNLFGTDAAAFELLCRYFNSDSEIAASLYSYFENHSDEFYRNKLKAIEKGSAITTESITQEQSNRLYGETMMVSPSQIEKYHLCQFSHFCRYGLNLKPLKVAEITALDTGNAIHEVMEHLLKDYSVSELSLLGADELTELIEKLLSQFLSLRIGAENITDNRIKYSIMRLKSTIVPVIKYVIDELEASGFTPRDFELDIRRGKDIEPYMLSSVSGNKIGIYGKVDRVDTLKTESGTYVRVIDYKSGTKDFSKFDLDLGLNLQMFLYLFSILKNGGSRYNDNLTPSGVLYMPAKKSEVSKKGVHSDEALLKEVEKGYKMKGIALDDENVRRSAPYFSVSYEQPSEFSYLQEKIEELILKMADELVSGNLKVNPLYVGRDNKACKFCDYHAICGFEEGDPCRLVNKEEKEVKQDG